MRNKGEQILNLIIRFLNLIIRLEGPQGMSLQAGRLQEPFRAKNDPNRRINRRWRRPAWRDIFRAKNIPNRMSLQAGRLQKLFWGEKRPKSQNQSPLGTPGLEGHGDGKKRKVV
jgi:hypothetical protein